MEMIIIRIDFMGNSYSKHYRVTNIVDICWMLNVDDGLRVNVNADTKFQMQSLSTPTDINAKIKTIAFANNITIVQSQRTEPSHTWTIGHFVLFLSLFFFFSFAFWMLVHPNQCGFFFPPILTFHWFSMNAWLITARPIVHQQWIEIL